MKQPSPTSLLLLASLLGTAACGDGNDEPPTPAALRARLRADLGNILDETSAAAKAGETALPNTAVLDLLANALPSDGVITGAKVRAKLDEEDPLDSDAAIEWLETNLFTDANHVGGGIYEVPAALVCSDDTGALDPECAADFAQVELRIRVTADDEELDFAVQVGANHDEPLLVSLSHTRVALSVDLDEAMAAAAQLAPLFGEELPNLDLGGQVTGALEVLGDDHAKATLSIDRALRVRFAEAGVALDGPDAFRFASAASPLLALEFDGPAEAGSLAVDVGETTVYEPEEQMALDLPGIAATASLAAGQPLRITGISLGDRTTTLTKAGAQAVAIDLNRDDGRALDLTLAADGADAATLTAEPLLDVRLAVDHAVLGSDPGVYDVTRVLLDGTLRGAEGSEQVEVVDGTFAISTDPASYGFSATAGQCVSGEERYDDDRGAYYTAWTAGVCE